MASEISSSLAPVRVGRKTLPRMNDFSYSGADPDSMKPSNRIVMLNPGRAFEKEAKVYDADGLF